MLVVRGERYMSENLLKKLYIEPTNECNMKCRTCIRNTWDEPMGKMTDEVFNRIIDGIKMFSPLPTIFFGGLGEPLIHPDIVEMVRRSKSAGTRVELISNGTMLSPKMTHDLLDAGLDMLWISLDGATPEGYADVRLGEKLPEILQNLQYFDKTVFDYMSASELTGAMNRNHITELGIAFVAMKRNISELPEVLKIGRQLHVTQFRVTNVLPYTKELLNEILYNETLNRIDQLKNPEIPFLNLPRIDENDITKDAIHRVRNMGIRATWPGEDLAKGLDTCPFIDNGEAAISWNGDMSPCLPLLHDFSSYILCNERYSKHWHIGNIKNQSLEELWHNPDYVSFLERLKKWPFAPCMTCGGCNLGESNEEDCTGNKFPTCGGCYYAQGLIVCP